MPRRRTHYNSYGVACFSQSKTGPKLLLIQKPTTYEFALFTRGDYNPTNLNEFEKLIAGMTIDERRSILTLDFGAIVARTFSGRYVRELYSRHIGKYRLQFIKHKNHKSMIRIIKNSNIAGQRPIWEIPKGRRQSHETSLITAIREFTEETGIPNVGLRMLPPTYSKTYTYTDAGATYQNKYFIAVTDTKHNIDRTIGDDYTETLQIAWKSLADIHQLSETALIPAEKKLHKFCKQIFKLLRVYSNRPCPVFGFPKIIHHESTLSKHGKTPLKTRHIRRRTKYKISNTENTQRDMFGSWRSSKTKSDNNILQTMGPHLFTILTTAEVDNAEPPNDTELLVKNIIDSLVDDVVSMCQTVVPKPFVIPTTSAFKPVSKIPIKPLLFTDIVKSSIC